MESNKKNLDRNIRFFTKEDPIGNRRIGAVVNLIPKDHVEFILLNGEKVISKYRAIELIREHRGIFAEADEIIEY